MHGVDAGAYYFFLSQAPELPLLAQVLRVVDFLGSLPVTATIIVGIVIGLFVRGRCQVAVAIFAIAVGGFACVEGVAWGLQAGGVGARPPEPDSAYAGIEDSPGFPSRSAFLTGLAYGLLAGVVGSYCPGRKSRLAIYGVFLVFILLHGFSQLFLRLHFLTDLLAGWNLGLVALLLCHQAAGRAFESRG
jgi:membrane-associated phospholipid phosphatase